MPVFIVDKHVQLIDDLLDIEDISRQILHHIDVEEIDRREKRKKKKTEEKRRWKRSSNTYDSYKFCGLRR